MEVSQNIPGKFLNPEMIISQLDLEQGVSAADFGSGPGYFSLPFAKAIGREGKVWALDILPQALETVASKSKNSGILNIETKRVNLEKEQGSKMDQESLDWVIMKDVLFQNKRKDLMVAEAHRILKAGGRVLVIEWANQDSGIGPDQELRVNEVDLKKIFENQGFSIEKELKAGTFHYAFVARK